MSEQLAHTKKPSDYTEVLMPEDFSYSHTIPPGYPYWEDYLNRVVYPAQEEALERFRIKVKLLPWGELPPQDGRIPYVSVGPVNPLRPPQGFKEQVAKLTSLPEARVNLLTVYPYDVTGDAPGYALTERLIPKMDNRLGTRTLYPDYFDGLYEGVRRITAKDYINDLVCQTIRLKYAAVRNHSPEILATLNNVQQRLIFDIEQLGRIFADYQLWHSGETDGAVLWKVPEGYFISQTRTVKPEMTTNNFSLVTEYDTDENRVLFAGRKLPSSDSPEFLVLADTLHPEDEKKSLIVHFHHLLTRSPALVDHVTQDTIEYGLFESTHAIAEEFDRVGDNWLILKEHGFLWIGASVGEFEDFVSKELNITS